MILNLRKISNYKIQGLHKLRVAKVCCLKDKFQVKILTDELIDTSRNELVANPKKKLGRKITG